MTNKVPETIEITVRVLVGRNGEQFAKDLEENIRSAVVHLTDNGLHKSQKEQETVFIMGASNAEDKMILGARVAPIYDVPLPDIKNEEQRDKWLADVDVVEFIDFGIRKVTEETANES